MGPRSCCKAVFTEELAEVPRECMVSDLKEIKFLIKFCTVCFSYRDKGSASSCLRNKEVS